MITLWTIWFLFILLEALRNWYVIERLKRSPDHEMAFIIRALVAMAIILIVQPSYYYALVLIGMGFVFWFVFDISINLMRGRAALYIGRTAWIDRKTVKYGLIVWTFKLIATVTSLAATLT